MPIKRIAASFLFCIGALAATAAHSPSQSQWVDTWSAPADAPGPALKAQTVRQVLRISAAGSHLRIRLSNLYGAGPITIGAVRVAIQASGSSIQPHSDYALTFDGKSAITLAKGASASSDSLDIAVAPLQELVISMYVVDTSGPSTIHSEGRATAYIVDGDVTADRTLPTAEINQSRFFVTDVEVQATQPANTLVTFGDSITDGAQSTPNSNRRWPDVLAERLQANPASASVSVANAGISGNRILNDGAGMSALTRFDRDALSKPHVRWIILLEGINDIGWQGHATSPKEIVSAQQVIDGMKTLIARAHAKGIKVYGATLTPFGGMTWPYHSVAGEQERQTVNTWIRTSGAFDAVLDFDKIMRDPAHSDRFLPAYDSGDHLHPGDAGYKAMADSIDLRLFDPKG